MVWAVTRRSLCTLALAIAVLAMAAGPASAAGQSLSISPCAASPCFPVSSEFFAGGEASVTMTMTLDSNAIASHGGPSSVTVSLASGVFASIAAAPKCVVGTAQYVPACLIGDGSAANALHIPLSFKAYLVPAATPGDVAGIDLVSGTTQTKTLGHAELSITQPASGTVRAAVRLDLSSLGILAGELTSLTFRVYGSVNGGNFFSNTPNGEPFTRMPSAAHPAAASELTVVYGSGFTAVTETTGASPDVTPDGVGAVRYAPSLRARAIKDAADPGVKLMTTVAQTANQAANRSVTLTLPAGEFTPNVVAALSLLNSATPVGTATATSPLIPAALAGPIFLTGSVTAPALTIHFPSPFPLTLVGALNLASDSLTFSGLPDVPLSRLTVLLDGGSRALLETTCATPSGTLSGKFVGQNGKRARARQTLAVSGCPGVRATGRPKLGARLAGLATGHPALHVTVGREGNGPGTASVSVRLPPGLGFNRPKLGRAIDGLSLSAGSLRTATSHGRTLVITLRRPAARVSVTVRRPLLVENGALMEAVRRHAVRAVRLSVLVTDARHHRTPLALSLSAR